MTTQGRTRLKVWLVLAGVFALGSMMGAALAGVYYLRHCDDHHAGRDRHDAFFERMRSDLNLTDAQTAQVKSIVDDSRNEFRALRTEARPRFDAIMQKERARIRGILLPEQQQRFDQMVARQDAMRERRDRDER